MPNSFLPYRLQHTRLPCPLLSPSVCSDSCLLNWWCHLTFSSSVAHFSSCPQSFPGSFLMSELFVSGGQRIGASASASVLHWIFRVGFLWDGLGGSPCSPRDSPTPQFESISSSALSLLCGLTFTAINDYQENHSFEYTDLCQHREWE